MNLEKLDKAFNKHYPKIIGIERTYKERPSGCFVDCQIEQGTPFVGSYVRSLSYKQIELIK